MRQGERGERGYVAGGEMEERERGGGEREREKGGE